MLVSFALPAFAYGANEIIKNFETDNGDIVVVHGNFEDANYNIPLVKRVIGTENQTLVIDFKNKTIII